MNVPLAALILTAVLESLAVARFFAVGAHRSSPVLVSFLSFKLAQTMFGAIFPANSYIYQNLYNLSEPIVVVFTMLVVRELHSQAFADYPGISSLTRWNAYLAAGLALVLSVAMIAATRSQISYQDFTGYVLLWERCVSFSLVAFIVLMIYMLSRYPIRIPRNLASNIAIFSAFFSGTFLLSFPGASSSMPWEWFAFYGHAALSCICAIAWAFALSPVEVDAVVRVRPRIDPGQEKALLNQLAALNQVLVKTARR